MPTIGRAGSVLTVSLALALAWSATAGRALAHPPYRRALATLVAATLAEKVNDCRTCHEGAGPRPGRRLNPFGERLQEIKFTLREQGKKSAILTRLELVADEDSDGDGVANLLELAAGHFPGDPRDTPTADEVATARRALSK